MSQSVKRSVAKKSVQQPEESVAPKFIIPSSRVHTYVSGFRLNKELDDKVNAVKGGEDVGAVLEADDVQAVEAKLAAAEDANKVISKLMADVEGGAELTAVLGDDQRSKVAEIIKKREEKNAKLLEDEREPIDIKDITLKFLAKELVTPVSAAVDVLSKHRAKFSKTSFDVLSVFSDVMVEELTKVAMTNLLSKKKNTVTPAFIFCDELKECKLFNFYSKLPTFLKAKADFDKPKPKKQRKPATQEEQPEEQPEAEPEVEPEEEVPQCKVNFDFYIKAICNKVKANDSTFADIKISEKYQKFCSGLIIDVLDIVSTVSQIVLSVMDTKTITGKLFKTCLRLQTFQCPSVEEVFAEVDARLE